MADEREAKRLAESLRDMIKEGATDDCSICMGDLNQPVSPETVYLLVYVLGDPSEWLKPLVELDFECSVILPGQ